MRAPKFLSPSAIETWEANREDYYLKYLADNRPPKILQNQPMSIGSAFDAYAKSYLVGRLFGSSKPEFAFDALFTQQVEEHNRDWARENGLHAFESYKRSGALGVLLEELLKAKSEPRFEFAVEGTINGVPLLGKPDVYFVSDVGARVLIDWKVNGYCAAAGAGPKAGYVNIYDGGERTKNHGVPHKDAHLHYVGGMTVNIAKFFEDVDDRWARQLAMYAWLLGEPVGSDFVVAIEQLACKPVSGSKPSIRVATHRGYVSKDFQAKLLKSAVDAWTALQNGHIFTDLSREDSDKRCKELDIYHQAYGGDTPEDKWFEQMTRRHEV